MRSRSRQAKTNDDTEQRDLDDKDDTGVQRRRLPSLFTLMVLAGLCLGGRTLWLRATDTDAVAAAASPGPSILDGIGGHVHASAAASAAKPVAQKPAGDTKPVVVETMSVSAAMNDAINKCRTAKPEAEDSLTEDLRRVVSQQSQVFASLECIFNLIYPPEETHAATYGLHTSHPENIYGEIPPESVMQIASELGLGPGAVFYDLGSGVGRMTLQVYLTTEAARAVGVEIAVPRHNVALKAQKALEHAGVHSLLVAPPPGRKVEFMAKDITQIDMSDATGIYMASLYFPKDVMWKLAEKLAQLKRGTRILTLVKFPFDVYGKRKLPKDSPMQALRLRKSFSNIRMTWSEENNVFLYEVDREEAFPPAFDAAAASSRQLLDEVYRRARIERSQFETPEFVNAVLNSVESLDMGQGDDICEVGATSGWMTLYLGLESKADKILSASIFEGDSHEMPVAKARAMLEELARGRIPWHRRLDFFAVPSLEAFMRNDAHGKVGAASGKDFASHCKGASIVVLHPMRSYENGLDALTKAAEVLPAGAIVLALGMEMMKNTACSFGLLPLLQNPVELPLSSELNLSVSLDIYAVAPKEEDITSLAVPGITSLQDAVRRMDSQQAELQRLTAEKLFRLSGAHDVGDAEATSISQVAVRHAVDATRFRRLRLVLGGITGDNTGKLRFPNAEQSADRHRRGGDLPTRQLARLWLSRFLGGAESAYSCLEANLYALASYAPAITKREKKAGLFPEHAATYGEVDPGGLNTLITNLGGLSSADTFFDLGSGLGKAVLQIFTSMEPARAVGVELSEARHKGAVEALSTMRLRFPAIASALEKGRSIEFLHEDVLKADIKGATMIWMGSLAFPQSLMEKLATRILQQANIGCRVATMLEFPATAPVNNRKLVEREAQTIRVRWSHAKEAKVYLYDIAASN